MLTNNLLIDMFTRIQEVVHTTVEGLDDEQLAWRPGPQANSIAWLIWHLSRIQDDHVAQAAGREQVWTAEGWHQQFKVPFDPAVTGYGQSGQDVAAVQPNAAQLLGYYDAVHTATTAYLSQLQEAEYGKIVDESYKPPVTLAIRLASVISDDLQHAGQAAYVRGLLPS